MATTTFTAASLIFINIWLIALVAFGVVVSSVFLYILDTVDQTIGPTLGISMTCAALSFTYLSLQCVNVVHVKQGRWNQSRLSSICIQLARALIVLWMIATIVGFVSAVRKPLCQSPSVVGQNVTAMQADIGCWIFRVLVFLDAIMLVLCFVLFCLLEVNGRYVSLALFHFEYTRSSNRTLCRRRNLIASPYGASVETLTYQISANSRHGHECVREKHDFQPKRSLSPSPTYHTFDSAKSNAQLWPGSAGSSSSHTRYGSRDDLPCDHPIPIDLTLHGPLPTRRSTAFTADIPYPHADDVDTKSIYSGIQLQSRPISHLPALPPPARRTLLDLKDAPDPVITAPIAAKALLDHDTSIRPALHNHEVNMVDPVSRLKSSCAVPFEFSTSTRAHSMVDLSTSCSMTDLTSRDLNPADPTIPSKKHPVHHPSIDTTRHISTSFMPPDHPAPAWCPQSLKSAPLSADPAIRRLTEFHSRSRASVMRASRISNMGRRRGSLGAFEFGFVEGNVTPFVSSVAGTASENKGGTGGQIDFSILPDPETPTPLARKRATISKNRMKEDGRGGAIVSSEKEKNNLTTMTIDDLVTNAPTDLPSLKAAHTSTTLAPKQGHTRMMSRARGRNNASISISTGASNNTRTIPLAFGQFSIMPPLTTHGLNQSCTKNRRTASNCTTASTNSGLGLTFEEGTGQNQIGSGNKKEKRKHMRNESMAVVTESGIGKKIVERGRWEMLPR